MHRIVRWQQELHEFAQHLEEIIHEEDEPLHTFYLSQFHQHQKPTSIPQRLHHLPGSLYRFEHDLIVSLPSTPLHPEITINDNKGGYPLQVESSVVSQ